MYLMKHIFFLEDPDGDGHGDDGDHRREPPPLHTRHPIDIHAIKAKDDIGDRHHDGDDRKHLHDDVQVVGDDRSESVHRAGQDVGINVTHLDGLMDLDEHIFQQILVFLIQLDELAPHDLIQRDLIGLQRCREIDK